MLLADAGALHGTRVVSYMVPERLQSMVCALQKVTLQIAFQSLGLCALQGCASHCIALPELCKTRVCSVGGYLPDKEIWGIGPRLGNL